MAEKVIKVKIDKIGAQRDLNAINKALKDAGVNAEVFKEETEGASGGLSKMIPKLTSVAGGAVKVGTAIATATAATIAFARSQALAIKELQKSARLAGLATQEFQAYSYAANNVGVSQEKFGDILKDVNDKVGDFITTGGGEFKDVFENVLKPIGVTTEQLREMSSVEVLGAVQKGLEQLGANGQEATFVLEAIANEATLLQPLLENNSKALNSLANEARDMGLIISPDQVQAANDFNAAFERTAGKVSTFSQLLTAEMAPALAVLVDLAGDLVTYLAEAFNLTIESQIESVTDKIDKQRAALKKLQETGESTNTYGALANAPQGTQEMVIENNIALLEKELKALQADLKAREQLSRVGISGEKTTTSGVTSTFGGLGGGGNDKQEEELNRRKKYLQDWIDNIATYNMSATELNDAWRASELEKLEEWRALNLEKEDEYNSAFFDINKKWADKNAEIDAKADADAKKKRDKKYKDEQDALTAGFDAFNAIADATEGRSDSLNALVKGAAVFQATANTWLAASQALALPGDVSLPQKMASYAAVLSAGMGIVGSLNGLSPSRQVGGYMNSNTPYQVGGGAHTTDPEMYTSGGKQYLIDSNAGKMTRLDKGSSSATGSVNFQLINNGSPVEAQITSDSVDEQGVRRIIAEMTPQVMAKEMGDKYSSANQARKRWERPQESYS